MWRRICKTHGNELFRNNLQVAYIYRRFKFGCFICVRIHIARLTLLCGIRAMCHAYVVCIVCMYIYCGFTWAVCVCGGVKREFGNITRTVVQDQYVGTVHSSCWKFVIEAMKSIRLVRGSECTHILSYFILSYLVCVG